MLALILPLGDGLVCNTLKHAVGRPRPYAGPSRGPSPGQQRRLRRHVAAAHVPGSNRPRLHSVAKGDYTSMPSSHAANWFAATMILFIYYRRSLWFMLPAAIAGQLLPHLQRRPLPERRAGGRHPRRGLRRRGGLVPERALAMGRAKLVSALVAECRPCSTRRAAQAEAGRSRRHRASAALPLRTPPWTSIGSGWATSGLRCCLLARLAYIASGTIQLAEDEAYQWLWSKHLALSYYSKPPLIAYTQFLGTSLWGDTAFGVRFFSPVIAAVLSLHPASLLRPRGQRPRRVLPAAHHHRHPADVGRRGADDR